MAEHNFAFINFNHAEGMHTALRAATATNRHAGPTQIDTAN